MDDSPEIVKLFKYIIFGAIVSHVIIIHAQPLVTKPSSVVPVPFYHSEEVRSDLISTFTENQESFRNGPSHQPQVQPKQDDLDPDVNSGLVERNSGGHKETRQAPAPSDLSRSPPDSLPSHHSRRFGPGSGSGEGLGSLCSIFRIFLEPRRFPRCHVSSRGEPQLPPPGFFDREGPSGPSGPLPSNELNHESHSRGPHQQGSHQHHGRNIDDFLRDGENNRNNNNDNRNNNNGEGPSSGPSHDQGSGGPPPSIPPQSIANKRYDHIDDIQINHSGELLDGDEHGGMHSGYSGPPDHQQQDPTKISQDRTMIVVPERNCPQGQRRDSRGYCRRLVKIRTNYHYGPPPGVVRPIPIRYYYSRIVAIPALHFFFPNV